MVGSPGTFSVHASAATARPVSLGQGPHPAALMACTGCFPQFSERMRGPHGAGGERKRQEGREGRQSHTITPWGSRKRPVLEFRPTGKAQERVAALRALACRHGALWPASTAIDPIPAVTLQSAGERGSPLASPAFACQGSTATRSPRRPLGPLRWALPRHRTLLGCGCLRPRGTRIRGETWTETAQGRGPSCFPFPSLTHPSLWTVCGRRERANQIGRVDAERAVGGSLGQHSSHRTHTWTR